MHIVAITKLRTSVEAEAIALAADLGTLPYEQRLKLAPGLPAIALATPDDTRAGILVDALRGRGHDVLRCLDTDVTSSGAMFELHTYRFETDALVETDPDTRLRWDDIAILIRAVHRTSAETRTTVKKKEFSLGRAVMSGGLIMRKATKLTTVAHEENTEAVLYLFPRRGKPWILREQHAHFDALGARVASSSAQNFALVVDELRTRAHVAVFDDRLATRKDPPAKIDLLAHLIATTVDTAIAPYR